MHLSFPLVDKKGTDKKGTQAGSDYLSGEGRDQF